MLKEKELNFVFEVADKVGNVGQIESVLQEKAKEAQILLATEKDQVKKGGMLNSSSVECLVLYHPSHKKDYFNFVLVVEQGSIRVYSYGESKNQKKLDNRSVGAGVMSHGLKQADHNAREGKSIGMTLTAASLIGGMKALSSIGGSKSKKQEEDSYYQKVSDLIKTL